MEWKVFFSTFLLIFLAELGDKTQLAAMAASAGTRAPWSIFFGAAIALIVSSAIAVICGTFLQKVIPPHYLKFGAALLFLLFGFLLLLNVYQDFRGMKKESTLSSANIHQVPTIRFYGAVLIDTAITFESATTDDYERLSSKVASRPLKQLFLHLASEEKSHLDSLKKLIAKYDHTKPLVNSFKEASIHIVSSPYLDTKHTDEIVDNCIDHEIKTEQFYLALASKALIPEFKNIFYYLANQEKSHVDHLQEFKKNQSFIYTES